VQHGEVQRHQQEAARVGEQPGENADGDRHGSEAQAGGVAGRSWTRDDRRCLEDHRGRSATATTVIDSEVIDSEGSGRCRWQGIGAGGFRLGTVLGEHHTQTEQRHHDVGDRHQRSAADPTRGQRADDGGGDAAADAPADHARVGEALRPEAAVGDERSRHRGRQRSSDGDDGWYPGGSEQRRRNGGPALAEHAAEEPDPATDQCDVQPLH